MLTAFHLDLVTKPWTTKYFWSSRTGVVCLNARHVLTRHELLRLLSGPIEDAGHVHFAICSIGSLVLKSVQLEKRRGALKHTGLLAVCTIGTSLANVLVSHMLSDVLDNPLYSAECLQGLSGLLFALKVICPKESESWVATLFELAERMMLLEKRTMLYHVSGLFVGLVYVTKCFGLCSPQQFSG